MTGKMSVCWGVIEIYYVSSEIDFTNWLAGKTVGVLKYHPGSVEIPHEGVLWVPYMPTCLHSADTHLPSSSCGCQMSKLGSNLTCLASISCLPTASNLVFHGSNHFPSFRHSTQKHSTPALSSDSAANSIAAQCISEIFTIPHDSWRMRAPVSHLLIPLCWGPDPN